MTLSSLNLLLFLSTTWYDLIATSVLSQASVIVSECGIVATLFNAELKPYGVKSIFIAPGSMKTPMGRKVKNQDFSTFIDPKEVAIMMKNLLNDKTSIFIDELKIKRTVYK